MITNLIDKPTNKLKILSNTMSEQFQNPRKNVPIEANSISQTRIYMAAHFSGFVMQFNIKWRG